MTMATEVLYKKIFNDLLSGIRSGAYAPGSRLPSEMDLADEYKVSRITSKKALEMLADRGLVYRQPGKGTFVASESQIRENDAAEAEPVEEPVPVKRGSLPMTVGVIFDAFDASFGMDILCGLEYECTRRKMVMMLRMTYGSVEAEKQAIADMKALGVSGIVLMGTQNHTYNIDILKLCVEGFPLVLVDRELKGIPIPVVTTDNVRASYELTQRLLRDGHKNIGYISHSHVDTSTIAARFEGFLQALREANVPMENVAVLRDMDAYLPKDDDAGDNKQFYKNELSDFIDSHPELTAFYAVEFSIARLLYQVLAEKDLLNSKTLVYFDGFRNVPVPLGQYVHVIQDQYQMGVTAMRTLAHKMRGEEVPEREYIQHVIVEPENTAF